MNRPRTLAAFALVFAGGALFGRLGDPSAAFAQDDADQPAELSEAAVNEVRASVRALETARDELEASDAYRTVTTGVNPFLVLSGGGDAMADLESENGVDPETFAALYAGRATDEVKEMLSVDDDGRLLFKGKAIRMYSIEKLKAVYAERDRFAAEDSGF